MFETLKPPPRLGSMEVHERSALEKNTICASRIGRNKAEFLPKKLVVVIQVWENIVLGVLLGFLLLKYAFQIKQCLFPHHELILVKPLF